MILNSLRLKDFCAYRGEQILDFTPAKSKGAAKPIVLFGGLNGGGKTTILDAIQLVLYGKKAKCSKRGKKAYHTFLEDCINVGSDPTDGCEVELTFRYVAEGTESIYSVNRSWYENSNRNISEKLRVSKDGSPNNWLSENWSSLVEEIIPQGIAQLCFFDAEKMQDLANDQMGESTLGDAIKSLLGLDLAERLILDVGVLQTNLAKSSVPSSELKEILEFEQHLEGIEQEKTKVHQQRAKAQNKKELALKDESIARAAFEKSGGEHWRKREQRVVELAEEKTRHGFLAEALREKASGELPLNLVFPLLREMSSQVTSETHKQRDALLVEMLEERDATILENLAVKNIDAAVVTKVAKMFAADRKARESREALEIHNELSIAGADLLAKLVDGHLEQVAADVKQSIEECDSSKQQLEDLQRGIAAAPKDESIRSLADDLNRATRKLTVAEQEYNRLNEQYEQAKSELAAVNEKLTSMRRKVVDEQIKNEEDARVAGLLARTEGTMREFLHQATRRKIDRLSSLITDSFRFLLHKKALVQEVVIDPETFSITLIDEMGNPYSKDKLSEGEKQMFAISVLWGLSQASALPLPTIIDTPMGRLDTLHRDQLIQSYFPNASHQVIILSTDTEVDQEYFEALLPHVARAYFLEVDKTEKVTVAREGYFWQDEKSQLQTAGA